MSPLVYLAAVDRCASALSARVRAGDVDCTREERTRLVSALSGVTSAIARDLDRARAAERFDATRCEREVRDLIDRLTAHEGDAITPRTVAVLCLAALDAWEGRPAPWTRLAAAVARLERAVLNGDADVCRDADTLASGGVVGAPRGAERAA